LLQLRKKKKERSGSTNIFLVGVAELSSSCLGIVEGEKKSLTKPPTINQKLEAIYCLVKKKKRKKKQIMTTTSKQAQQLHLFMYIL
jgi:hypothetical protein